VNNAAVNMDEQVPLLQTDLNKTLLKKTKIKKE
jgi:hypothetical protein